MGNEIPDIQITDDSSSIQGTVTQEPASKTFYIRLKPAFATSDKGKDLTSGRFECNFVSILKVFCYHIK